MSNPVVTSSGTAAASDGESRDPVTDAQKRIEEMHAAIAKVRDQVDETARLLGELARISTVFDSVGDRLVNATFKASGDATRGVPSHAVLVSFVEELGDLARLALGGARDVRRELRARAAKPGQPGSVLLETELALNELSAALKRLALRPVRQPATTIEIENRTTPPPTPRTPSPLERALAAGIFAAASPNKTGGYKN